jgi:uncharacterized protein DUF4832/glycosyl hydrolase family 42 (putative beta-galactosidase)
VRHRNKLWLVLSAVLVAVAGIIFFSCIRVIKMEIEPVEIEDTLLNPGRGFVTSHRFNEDMKDILHHRCSVAQYSFYWDELEPEEGRYNFIMLDSLLERAQANGQKLNFRVMCQNGRVGVPRWLREKGLGGQPYPDGKSWQPDYEDPLFMEKHSLLIEALGERYDGHPDVDCIDIATLGRWGEWHTWETGVEMPPEIFQRKVVDLYLSNFTKTPLLMQIGGGPSLAYAVGHGAGWRADCFGDMGGVTEEWSHMENMYQQALDAAVANDAWKQGPVVFETCWTMQFWHEKGWDLDFILSEALRWHVSQIGNKSEAVPEQWWPSLVDFEKKMGYRFALKRFAHPSRIKAGDAFACEMQWENRGVAPCYLNYPLAFEFRSSEGGESWIVKTDQDITGWLPGPVSFTTRIVVPEQLAPGEYRLGLALLDPQSGNPAIKLAVEGRAEDGWYRLSRVKVK